MDVESFEEMNVSILSFKVKIRRRVPRWFRSIHHPAFSHGKLEYRRWRAFLQDFSVVERNSKF